MNLEKPRHQIALTYGSWILTGLMALGGLLQAVGVARELITPAITYIGTALVILCLVSFQGFLKKHGLDWFAGGSVTRIRGLNLGLVLPFVGMVVLLWIPRLVPAEGPKIVIMITPTPEATSSPKASSTHTSTLTSIPSPAVESTNMPTTTVTTTPTETGTHTPTAMGMTTNTPTGAPIGIPTSTPTHIPVSGKVYLLNLENLRDEPYGTKSSPVAYMPGTEFELLLRHHGGYLWVSAPDGQEGWVHENLVAEEDIRTFFAYKEKDLVGYLVGVISETNRDGLTRVPIHTDTGTIWVPMSQIRSIAVNNTDGDVVTVIERLDGNRFEGSATLSLISQGTLLQFSRDVKGTVTLVRLDGE